jgi:hypothetical protein
MKNIHILPTEKPSRLYKDDNQVLTLNTHPVLKGIFTNGIGSNQHIYITSDEEIKEGDWFLSLTHDESYLEVYKYDGTTYLGEDKKIILTTDQDLIKDSVQAIGDEFIELFVKNLNCESIEVCKNPFYEESNYEHYKIITPKEEPKQESIQEFIEKHGITEQQLIDGYKQGLDLIFENASKITKQETLEEAAEKQWGKLAIINDRAAVIAFKAGAKWQAERMYSEEEVYDILVEHTIELFKKESKTLNEWFEQFKK